MAYIVPKVLIQQEFTQIPVYTTNPLAAFIIGPQFNLARYNVASEKPNTEVVHPTTPSLGNAYQPASTVLYAVPGVVAGTFVDSSYTKVFFENVVATYFPLAAFNVAPQSNQTKVGLVTAPSSNKYPNRLKWNPQNSYYSSSALQSQYGYTRSTYFSNRDVQVGDVVSIIDDSGNSLTSQITGLIRDTYRENSSLSASVGSPVFSSTSGSVANPATNIFTDSTVVFTQANVGQFLTVTAATAPSGETAAIAGTTYRIVGIQSVHSVVLDRVFGEPIPGITTGSGITYHINGNFEDPSNIGINNILNPSSATYAWAGATTAPSAPNFTVAATYSATWVGHKALRIMGDTIKVTVASGTNVSNATFNVVSSNGAFVPVSGVAATGVGSGGTETWTLVIDTDDAGNTITLTFPNSASISNAFSVGMSWSLTFQAPTVNAAYTTAGTYTGVNNTVYKITVIRGGNFYDPSLNGGAGNANTCAQVAITADNGDSSPAVLVPLNSAITVGNYGVAATFTAGTTSGAAGLVAGDIYYITAQAASLGAVNVIQIADNLPSAILNASNPNIYLTLSLNQASTQIPPIKNLTTGTHNWQSLGGNEIQINSGVVTTDPGIIFGGVPLPLTITSANIYVEHRDLTTVNSVSIGSVNNEADVTKYLGTVHPDNPLAQGVYNAVLNSNDASVYYIGLISNDLAGYNYAIGVAQKSDKVYGFVPLTFDEAVQEAVVSHVNAYSTPQVGLWRVAWLSIQDKHTAVLYGPGSILDQATNMANPSSPTAWVGTITADPLAANTQNTLLTVSGATFITDGIRPGDSIRMNFSTDSQGNQTYQEYAVAQVRSQTTLVIATQLPAPLVAPVLIEIIRNYTLDERAQNLADIGGSYMNRRVRVVFPDTYGFNGQQYDGYFLAAALAGLRSGVVPHQGLTNTQILGADDLSKVVNVYTQDQLNVMAERGIWLVTQEIVGAVPYVRHQLTTDSTNLNTSEDSITTNVDSISYGLKSRLSPYIGTYNINPANIQVIRDAIINQMNFYATQTYTVRAGNQLVSFTPATDILEIQQDPTYLDRIDVKLQLHVPYPLNYINLTLVV